MTKAATRRKAESRVGSVKPYGDKWRGRATVSLLNGESKRLQVYGRTYAEARERLDGEIQAAQRGTLADSKITVGDYLSVWLERSGGGLKPTTLAKYQDAAQKLAKHLPKVRLDKLTPMQTETALNAIQTDTAARTKGRSDGSETVKKCRNFLRKVYNDAMRLQHAGHNPVEHTAPPKGKRKRIVIWSPEDIGRFLTAAQPHRLYPMLYLAFETGLRRGELLGLHWDDIDFLRHKLHVRHNLVKAGKTLHLYDTKSESGDRDIDIDPAATELLKTHRQRQEAERAEVEIWRHPELVFVSEIGTFINPDNVTRLVKGLCKVAGVPYKSIHKMRHTSLSLYHHLGATPAELSYRAGHSRISTTTDIYIHPTGQRTPFSIGSVLESLKNTAN